ncbi:hypothetical protein MWG46_15425 [Escherichia coli]|nr:hypothetical protein [Escherichia coli]
MRQNKVDKGGRHKKKRWGTEVSKDIAQKRTRNGKKNDREGRVESRKCERVKRKTKHSVLGEIQRREGGGNSGVYETKKRKKETKRAREGGKRGQKERRERGTTDRNKRRGDGNKQGEKRECVKGRTRETTARQKTHPPGGKNMKKQSGSDREGKKEAGAKGTAEARRG